MRGERGLFSEIDRIVSVAETRSGLTPGHVKVVPWIETARAVLTAYDLATASQRIVAVAFGAEDYTNDIGVRRSDSGGEVYFARATMAVAARAAGVVALDSVYVRFRDEEGLRKDIQVALDMGYKGKFAIHPDQLAAINEMFSPLAEDLDYARRVVEVWEQAEAQGRGAASLDGRMIDVPVVKRARNLLALAETIVSRTSEG